MIWEVFLRKESTASTGSAAKPFSFNHLLKNILPNLSLAREGGFLCCVVFNIEMWLLITEALNMLLLFLSCSGFTWRGVKFPGSARWSEQSNKKQAP